MVRFLLVMISYILLILPEKTINITVHVCSNNSFTDMSPKNESCPNKSCTPLSRHYNCHIVTIQNSLNVLKQDYFFE